MKILFIAVCVFCLVVVGYAKADEVCATEQCEKAAKIFNLPEDVNAFVWLRDGCDYFRSEPWPEGNDTYSKERRQFILKNLEKTCTGTDRKLMDLRNKYRNNQAVYELLKGYEDRIEVR